MRIVRVSPPPLDFSNSKAFIEALGKLHDANERNYYYVMLPHFFRFLENNYFPEELNLLHKVLSEGNTAAASEIANNLQEWCKSLQKSVEELNT
jgi:hypothetical protein